MVVPAALGVPARTRVEESSVIPAGAFSIEYLIGGSPPVAAGSELLSLIRTSLTKTLSGRVRSSGKPGMRSALRWTPLPMVRVETRQSEAVLASSSAVLP